MSSGIYAITCTVNGKQYVGQTEDFEQRWSLHRSQLLYGIHHSRYLQRAWDKYGADLFTFEVLESVEAPDKIALMALLDDAETRWFDVLHPAYVSRPPGSQRGYKHRPESRAKMSTAAKRRGAPVVATEAAANANRGKTRSAETRAKISATKLAAKQKRPDLAERNQTQEMRDKVSAALSGRAPIAAIEAAAEAHRGKPVALHVAAARREGHRKWVERQRALLSS